MKFLLHPKWSILVPEQIAKLPDEIGFGCPKCDLCFMVPVYIAENNKQLSQFVSAHQACGPLEALEKKDGRMMVKGIKQG